MIVDSIWVGRLGWRCCLFTIVGFGADWFVQLCFVVCLVCVAWLITLFILGLFGFV